MRMLAVLAVFALASGCAEEDQIEVASDVLITVTQKPGASVSCSLSEDKKTCSCTISECGPEGLKAMAEQCWRLEHPIVVE